MEKVIVDIFTVEKMNSELYMNINFFNNIKLKHLLEYNINCEKSDEYKDAIHYTNKRRVRSVSMNNKAEIVLPYFRNLLTEPADSGFLIVCAKSKNGEVSYFINEFYIRFPLNAVDQTHLMEEVKKMTSCRDIDQLKEIINDLMEYLRSP